MFYADVLINKKIVSLDHTFVYEIPPHLIGSIQIGSVVGVPFGHTAAKGIVLSLRDDPGEFTPKLMDELIHDTFLFPQDLLELGAYISEYYVNTTISVLKAMIPTGINIFGKIQKPKVQIWLKLKDTDDLENIRGKKQKELYTLLKEKKQLLQKEIMETYGFSSSVIQGLLKKDYIEAVEVPIKRYSYLNGEAASTPAPAFTKEQQKVLFSISQRDVKDMRPILLHGVTGSGKTEIYLHLVEQVINKGQQAIVLLPEIALTPQFIRVFQARFSNQVVLMHSRLSSGERRDAWFDTYSNRAKVILGARSAIFAPVQNLGLIIMDEEHEDSYEQDTSPRFHTRIVAEKRAKDHNALFLLGSATPSFESYQKALDGEYLLLEMSHRVDESPLPQVEVVDMRQELKDGWTSVLSRSLIREIDYALGQKEQVMLFLNRLGANTFVSCRDCGFVYQCPHCGVSMVYFKSRNTLRCNRCEYEIPMEATCPQCQSKRIRYFGLGTEGLEKVVREQFPTANIQRMDSDSTRFKGQFDKIYEAMKCGEIDILIGTKMMSKGWDFPKVTLTGIIAADLTLNFPDFRAGEHAFQSITQVSGRCGRGKTPGKVILQTYRPEEKVLQLGASQNYAAYFGWENEKRRKYSYPPYAEIVKVIFTVPRGFLFQQDIDNIKASFAKVDSDIFLPLGPVPAIYRYERENEKWVLTLMGTDLKTMKSHLKEGFKHINSEIKNDKNVKIQIEINPQHIV